MGAVVRARGLIESPQPVPFGGRQGPAIGPRGELFQRRQVGGFSRKTLLFHASDVGGDQVEMLLDGELDRLAGVVAPRLLEIEFGEAPDLCLARHGFVLRAIGVKFRVAQVRGIRPFKPEETGVHPLGDRRGEIEFLPQPVELPAAGLVEDQVTERGVVAEVAGHAMEAGTQQASGVLLFLLGIEVNAGSFGDIKGVGKNVGEPGEGLLSRRAGTGPGSPACFRASWARMDSIHAMTFLNGPNSVMLLLSVTGGSARGWRGSRGRGRWVDWGNMHRGADAHSHVVSAG